MPSATLFGFILVTLPYCKFELTYVKKIKPEGVYHREMTTPCHHLFQSLHKSQATKIIKIIPGKMWNQYNFNLYQFTILLAVKQFGKYSNQNAN
jgi:hypothetical protein